MSDEELETIKRNVMEGGFQLLSFKNVEGDYDDGCVCTGHVNLTFSDDGKPLTIEAIFTTGSPRQVCVITPHDKNHVPMLSKWNKYACGGDF